MPPPIQLVDYVPEEFHFEVNPAYRNDPELAQSFAEEGEEGSVSIDVDWSDPEVPTASEGGDSEDEVLFFNLTIYVNENEDFEEENSYRIQLRLSGLFQRTPPDELFDNREGEEDYLLHTLSSCISMLYGTARSEIASMTSQAPYGKFLLPPVSPVQIARSIVKDNEGDVSHSSDAAQEEE
jgi:preprotein translocase subunit SecB